MRGSRPGRGLVEPLQVLIRDDLPDLLFGSRCVGCEKPGRALCPGCAVHLAGSAYETTPDPAPPGLPKIWTTAAYDGVVRAALIAHKERGRTTLAGPLGRALATAVGAALDAIAQGPPNGMRADGVPADGVPADGVLVVPVPSARASIRARGYDPLLVLARRAVRLLNRHRLPAGPRRVVPPPHLMRPVVPPAGRRIGLGRVLRLNRVVADQAGLSSARRRANLEGAFEVVRRARPVVAGRPVIVVDDLVTTGATLQAVTAALRQAGAVVCAAAVVAATPRRVSHYLLRD